MAKKHGAMVMDRAAVINGAGGGESAVSLIEKYSGRTKLLNTGFPPSWEPAKVGEQVLGTFIETRVVPKGPKVEKEYNSYSFKLMEWTAGATFKRQETEIPASVGLIFGISGKVLDDAMSTAEKGEAFVLSFNGLGQKKKGRSQAKLIELHKLA